MVELFDSLLLAASSLYPGMQGSPFASTPNMALMPYGCSRALCQAPDKQANAAKGFLWPKLLRFQGAHMK